MSPGKKFCREQQKRLELGRCDDDDERETHGKSQQGGLYGSPAIRSPVDNQHEAQIGILQPKKRKEEETKMIVMRLLCNPFNLRGDGGEKKNQLPVVIVRKSSKVAPVGQGDDWPPFPRSAT